MVFEGHDVCAHRKRLGMTQTQLADLAKISVRTLRDIEKGRHGQPRAASMERLAAALRQGEAQLCRPPTGKPAFTGALTVGILGPMVVSLGATAVHIASAYQKTMLGLLALHAGHTVSPDEIAETIWERPPAGSWRNLVHVHVNRLRSTLDPDRGRRAPCRWIVSTNGSYRLDMSRADLDVLRFAELATAAQAAADRGDTERACAAYEQALTLWRGPVLSGADDRVRRHPQAYALHRRKLDATLAYAALAVSAGRADKAASWLQELAAEEPLHEGLHASLMLALAGRGEQAAALRVFTDVRVRLADQLGVDPGPHLRAAHAKILQAEAVSVVVGADRRPTRHPDIVPAQLPAAIAAFHARSRELDRLDSFGVLSSSTICVITGMAGVGKTALAAHWAHRVKETFPDGQLYADLRGYSTGSPRTPLEVLTLFLRALGVPPLRVPLDLDEAAGLYRTMLADRRVLVVLDNARNAAQVRPLLPGGPGCRAIVTGRTRLTGLVAREDAVRIGLQPFTPAESVGLLRAVLKDQAHRMTPQLAGLAEACGHLPLALRIAVAKIADHTDDSLTGYLDRLAAVQGGLGGLSVDDDPQASVSGAFELSYCALTAGAQRAFRLLGVVPGGEATAASMAAMASMTPSAASEVLGILADAHLAEQRLGGRFGMHDLLRRYAHEAQTDDRDVHEAIRRLYDFALASVNAAGRLLYGHAIRLPDGAAYTDASAVTWQNAEDARQWLDAELASLSALVRHCAANGPHAMAWLLADALRGYFWIRRRIPEWLQAATLGLRAAIAAGDQKAVAAMHLSLGQAYRATGDPAQAEAHLHAAHDAGCASDWHDVQASALTQLAVTGAARGGSQEAAGLLARARAIYGRTGRRSSEAVVLTNLGTLYYLLGDIRMSVEHGQAALDLYRQTGNPSGEATVLCNLGINFAILGMTKSARLHVDEGLRLAARVGDPLTHALGEQALARLCAEAGDRATALLHAETAVDQARAAGDTAHIAMCAVEAALIRLDGGDLTDAVARLIQLRADARGAGHAHTEALALIGLGRAQTMLGRRSAAAAGLHEALLLARQWQYAYVEGEALRALAALALADERLVEARTLAAHGLALLAETGYWYATQQARDLLASVDATVAQPSSMR